MELLLETTGVDRTYIFYNSYSENGDLLLSQKFEACKEGIEPQIDNPELQNMPYSDIPFLHEKMKNNRIINKRVSEFSSPEKELMESQDINSLLILPIFVGDEWYGFLGFDSVVARREWEAHELITLQTTVGLIGTFLKRLSVKESLIQQKNFTQQLLNNLPSVVVVVDKDFQLLLWNKTGQRVTGYSDEELNSMSVFDLVSTEDHSKIMEAVQQIYSKNSSGLEIYLKDKKGMKSPYFWRASTVEMEGQEVFLIIGMDISRQKEMEKALLHEKRFANAIIDGLPGTFFMLDEDYNLVRCNKNLAQDVGYTVDELLNTQIFRIFSEESRKRILSKKDELFEKGKINLESDPINRNGKKLYRNVNAVLFERDGQRFIIGTGQDISELKNREQELRSTLHEKEILLQEIHHRVKNNLAVISGLLELQANEHADSKFKRLIKESQLRIHTMAMIHEKLYESQNLTRISVAEYIHQLVEHIKNSISYGETKVEIEMDIADVELNINIAIPFALALNEIVTNALEHAFVDKESGRINIKLEEKEDCISTTIEDNGVGISGKKNPKERNSLGFTLIEALLSQIEADWNLTADKGLKYEIQFSKSSLNGSSNSL